MNNLVMEITNYKSINKAIIEINKINVVGGVNGSGKSTVSRILYSFLKANSTQRKGFVLRILIERINKIIDTLNVKGNELILPNHLTIENNFSEIIGAVDILLDISKPWDNLEFLKEERFKKKLKKELYYNKVYHSCLAIYSDLDEYFGVDTPFLSEKIFNELLLKEHVPVGFNKNSDLKMIVNRINKVIDTLNFKGNDYILPYHLTFEDDFSKILRNLNLLLNISKTHDKIANEKKKELKKKLESKFNKMITSFSNDGIDTLYLQYAFNSVNDGDYTDVLYILYNITDEYPKYLDYYLDFNELCDTYSFFYYNCDVNFLCKSINSVIHEFFSEEILLSGICVNDVLLKDIEFNSNFRFNIVPKGEDGFDYFFKNFINNVYYVDNVSILDYPKTPFKNHLFHMNEIVDDLFAEYGQNIEITDESKKILEKIDNIVKGRYDKNTPMFVSDKTSDALDYVRYHVKNVTTYSTDTPSGVKQIGIIQLLLLNGKLQEGGYLIIDEPEVNLHPDWQYKFAQILVLLSKDLNITIYLNSHSPFFIEAIDAFAEFYDMQSNVNYYLSEFDGVGKYNFNKIGSDELYKIYDNLGDAYDLIDQLRLKKHLGE